MRSSQLFAAITVALGAIFLGTCIYFREDLGIPTEVFTGGAWTKQPGPVCVTIARWEGVTTRGYSYYCTGFPASLDNDSEGHPVIPTDSASLQIGGCGDVKLSLRTINPSIRETCSQRSEGTQECDFNWRLEPAQFFVAYDGNSYYTGNGSSAPVLFKDIDNCKGDTYQYKKVKFEFHDMVRPSSMCVQREIDCIVRREETFRHAFVVRYWQLNNYRFSLVLTITD